ncbi:hypothetical protein GCE86_03080 [Micromonospora terminaliae]|uniref:Uncharacterized protein n=1 Tax=Micromonospora terminaliae TaxID=1914461 RepID=A0AAJ2ZL99_9ACTN|nr:hypothetical protein [Micromonospora terminaliae]NES31701.1 hypothetical protein [Micromonospora terminaliae]QGL46118.1 hypothetical protein GCE86_03080 [Micromonospora terminaliae]
MRVEVAQPGSSMLRRAVAHPAVWSLPVMALLVFLAMPFNDGFYELWVNYDPQGDAQQHEWIYTERVFRYTSGVLCGQLLALLAGAALARRHAQITALMVAVSLAVALAGVTFAVAYPLARAAEGIYFTTAPLDDPVLVRVLVRELAAYPLYAAAGVGLSVLLRGLARGGRWLLLALLAACWCAATLTGLLQDDRFNAPYWLLWAAPPIAAGAAVALAALSIDVWSQPPVLMGDWGSSASAALLTGAAAYALGLNLLGGLAERRRRRRSNAGTGPSSAHEDPGSLGGG